MRDALFWLVVITVGVAVTAWLKPEWFPASVQRWVAPELVAAREAEQAQQQAAAALQARADARAKENPPLYQWRDEQGRLHITDKPPVGRAYETKRYDQNTNVIPALPGGQ